MAECIQNRRGRKARWEAINPILAEGEVGLEYIEDAEGNILSGYKEKIGTGTTPWNELPYHVVGEAGGNTTRYDGDVIGVCLVQPGGGYGTWARVDAEGNEVFISNVYFDGHPTYRGIENVIVDGQHMIRIPKFYIATAPHQSGKFLGRPRWTISPTPHEGFRVHPAFMKAGKEIDCFYIGKYSASLDEGGKPESLPGKICHIRPPAEIPPLCETRNVNGVSGFSSMNIYQLSAIQMLILVELATGEYHPVLGEAANNTPQYTDEPGGTWRGIVGIYRRNTFLDGIKAELSVTPSDVSADSYVTVHKNNILIFDNTGHRRWITTTTGVPFPKRYLNGNYLVFYNNSIIGFATGSGDEYDISDVFIADQLYSEYPGSSSASSTELAWNSTSSTLRDFHKSKHAHWQKGHTVDFTSYTFLIGNGLFSLNTSEQPLQGAFRLSKM